MPTTSPDGISYPDTSWTGGFVSAMAAMATTIQTAFSKRQDYSYRWADQTARLAQTGMVIGALGYQADTTVTYRATSTTTTVPWSSPWVTFAPTLANITLGTASVTDYKYRYEQGSVRVKFLIQLGTSGMAMGNNPTMTLPVTAATPVPTLIAADGTFWLFDASTTGNFWAAGLLTSTTVLRFVSMGSTAAGITATAPFTWAASDVIRGNFTYEI